MSSILDPDQICKHQLNDSISKMQYSFSKAKRFQDNRRYDSPGRFYNLPSYMNFKQGTHIGYGHKHDFTKATAANPAPNLYQIGSEFEKGKQKKGSWTFGLKDPNSKRYLGHGFKTQDKSFPGPGSYNLDDPLGQKSVKYTIRPKTVYHLDSYVFNKNPGPSDYKQKTDMPPTGFYYIQGSHSSRAPVLSPPIKMKKNSYRQSTPGPCDYSTNTQMNNTGFYYIQGLNSKLGKSFGRAPRTHISDTQASIKYPGPGSYRMPSDFGLYERPITQDFLHKKKKIQSKRDLLNRTVQ